MPIKKRILVVEDHQINRMMLRGILSSDYQVLEAENGEEALLVLQQYGEGISLILLDLVMPVMDGYTFLSIIKADPAYSNIPVIVTTQSDGEADEVAALSHGATDFVAKPYKPQAILHRVASIINLRETAAIINLIQYDRVTGIYGREFFYRKVTERLAQHPERAYDILCSDIEGFKLVNDVFGTSAGNQLLCGIAEFYVQKVGENGICGRLHADQFICLIEHHRTYTDAMFQEATDQINALSSAGNLVIKWGIYHIQDRTVSVEQMCDRALLAARSIKGQYGKYFADYDDALRGRLLREQAITDSMAAALAERQFEIYLQPKYRVDDDSLAGAEALVRWRHPEWGMQSPGEFIPLFEKNGFITELDRFVWEQTCATLRAWDDQGLPPISVSVNVSRADIYNTDLPNILVQTVRQYGLPPARLHLEITESAYTENPRQIIDTVRRLRELGFVIEMDDFGSGYSSLNMLNELPIDILKLDMKFIQSETAKPMSQGILHFIMDLARWMNLSVVAEGVETREQLERLREIGCDYVQGYYFAKPMPCVEFEQLLRERRLCTETARRVHSAPQEARPVLLVVDEDAAYRAQVGETFGDRYQAAEAADGFSALEQVKSRRIAAVILSLNCPGGMEALTYLQRERAVWDIPVIATAPADAALEERALEMGVDDFAGKPHAQASLRRRTLRAVALAGAWKQERLLQEALYQDSLTGLLNRQGLETAIGGLRRKDAPLALYVFRLPEGCDERASARFGEILRTNTRESDLLGHTDEGEFSVVMRRMESAACAVQKGEALCRAAREDGLTAACGIVLWNQEHPVTEITARARQALLRAQSGREGGCCLWEGRES